MAEAAFTELQTKLMQKTAALKQAAQQSRLMQTQQARSKLVAQELDKLPEEAVCYECIGRAYFSAPKSEISRKQSSQVQECGQQIVELKRVSEIASREINGVEEEIKEYLRENSEFAQRFLAQSA